MEAALKDYANCVELIFHKKRVFVESISFEFTSENVTDYGNTVYFFFAIHGDLSKIWELFATQIYVVLGSNCVPIPGAIGVADYLMLSGYKELMSKSDAYHLEILSRGLSFYGCMMISMITVLVGYICLRKKKYGEINKMIGFYDYTVILTYLSILSGTTGIILCLNGVGHPYLGMFFLLFSGLCDTFDGKVARSKKDRTEQMKKFGIRSIPFPI